MGSPRLKTTVSSSPHMRSRRTLSVFWKRSWASSSGSTELSIRDITTGSREHISIKFSISSLDRWEQIETSFCANNIWETYSCAHLLRDHLVSIW